MRDIGPFLQLPGFMHRFRFSLVFYVNIYSVSYNTQLTQ